MKKVPKTIVAERYLDKAWPDLAIPLGSLIMSFYHFTQLAIAIFLVSLLPLMPK